MTTLRTLLVSALLATTLLGGVAVASSGDGAAAPVRSMRTGDGLCC